MHSSFVGTVGGPPGASSPDPTKQIFIKNCPKAWTHADLYEHFVPFGDIASCKVSITASFVSRCYGFVEYLSADSVKKAVAAMDGKILEAAAAPSSTEQDLDADGLALQQLPLQVTNFESKRQRVK